MVNKANQFKNKKILIYGFGKSGRACFDNLKKNNKLFIYDDNKSNIKNNFSKFYINKKKLVLDYFNYIVISPGIDIKKCAIKKYLFKNRNKLINELDIFYLKNKKNTKITITGTNGKSTTSKLIFEILKKHKKDVRLVGNIGKPLLFEKKIKPKTIFVIEASSYQIDYSRYFRTNYALILNITPDHLERHGTLKNYVESKFKLIKKQTKDDYALIEKENKLIDYEIKKIDQNQK